MVTREKQKIERKENKQKPKMHILFYPKVYYVNIFHPILTYINDATKFGLDYEMKKEQPTTLCMCHDSGVYDAVVVVTWVPCPYLQK